MRRTNKLLKALKGWEFDVKALRASEGAFLSLDRRSPRADITNVHPKQGDNLPDGLSPNGNRCEYSGLRSTSSYLER
jgi:hypothetical protein